MIPPGHWFDTTTLREQPLADSVASLREIVERFARGEIRALAIATVESTERTSGISRVYAQGPGDPLPATPIDMAVLRERIECLESNTKAIEPHLKEKTT